MSRFQKSKMTTNLSTSVSSQEFPSDSSARMMLFDDPSGARRPEEKDPIQDEMPLMSVLNTVVDHIMVPPTPLEPEEFRQDNKSCRVPVLRVFGPVLRRDSGVCIQPSQSACLYIHGAFPYLLARPVVAGPDGSMHHASHLYGQEDSSGYVDWDSVESVERILPDLHASLEAAIQASMQVPNQSETTTVQDRVIRRITIVKGRGFYTYCPGPPAPFLRVEYYNPKLRWKVKLMLERGLDVPRSFHPDPLQYQSTLTPPLETDVGAVDPLVFHCYEAHIPYTMQFFKDWNLAGMQYIHLSGARFRHPMPKHVRQRRRRPLEQDDNVVPEEALFLRSNTPVWNLWNDHSAQASTLSANASSSLSMESQIACLQQPSAEELSTSQDEKHDENRSSLLQVNASVDPFWTRKETSCDIEMDVSVEQILNIKSVMTALPEDQQERDKVHWRAVPSLRELWRIERQRMAKLLQPKDDFLSQHPDNKDVPSFTLNTKDTSVPGTRLAVEGMHRLFRPSHGLEEQFRRAMKQIIERHSKSVERVDNMLRERASLGHTRRALLLSSSQTSESSHMAQSSPPMDAAMQALGALASQFKEDDTDEGPRDNDESVPQHADEHERWLSQSSTQTSDQQVLSQRFTQDPFEFSQRVERGDSAVDDPAGSAEELIDPATLTPYDPLEHDEVGFVEEEEAMSEGEFEHTLSVLATQSYVPERGSRESVDSHDEDGMNLTSHRDVEEAVGVEAMRSSWRGTSEEDAGEDSDVSRHDESGLVEDYSFGSCSKLTANNESEALLTPNAPAVDSQHASLPTPLESPHSPIIAFTRVERKENAPKRFEVARPSEDSSGPNLHLLQRARAIPSWLRYSNRYSDIRGDLVSRGVLRQDRATPQNVVIEPVVRAPTRRKVKSWESKKRKREDESSLPLKSRNKRSRSKKDLQAKSSEWANDALQIDGNSLKLISEPSLRKKKRIPTDLNSPGDGVQEIEEVEWESSERPYMSMSQSQPDSVDETVADKLGTEPASIGEPGSASRDEPAKSQSDEKGSSVSSDQRPPFPSTHDTVHGSERVLSDSTPQSGSPSVSNPLAGIGQQGGKIYVEGEGGLKAKSRSTQNQVQSVYKQPGASSLHGSDLPTPVSMMCIEVHVQCRMGRAGVNDSKKIAMHPNPEKDRIFAIVYVCARDPGGGETLEFIERGCLFVPTEGDQGAGETKKMPGTGKAVSSIAHLSAERMESSLPAKAMGISAETTIEVVRDERQLLLRLASIVRLKDPDMLLSWDTQGAGLGYIIERGAAIEQTVSDTSLAPSQRTNSEIDMVRLLGRTPRAKKPEEEGINRVSSEKNSHLDPPLQECGKVDESAIGAEKRWTGSGLGAEWDDRVGAGAAAASINGRLVFSAWKIVAEEVKHPNASYLPAIVSTVLNKRIPFHDDLQLTRWYGYDRGRERWRVLHHRLTQAVASLLLFDSLDVVGRAAEAAQLSGVEFSQSFPGIRGSQYKVEGVLLRALQSINADERGAKRGHQGTTLSADSRKLGIDQSSSQSSSSKSQTQSPWKMRRRCNAVDDTMDNLPDGNYFFFSPSLQDCSRQEALECQALTLEPKSACYNDPVVVCDFTALYPSLMIAYNLCYSTCAGKLDYHSTRREMLQEGATTGRIGPLLYPEARTATVLNHQMKSLSTGNRESGSGDGAPHEDRAYVAPTGTIFVSESILKGVLPQVLDEILTTRAMLKKAAKHYKALLPDVPPSVLRQLEARQLAIKMIANVIYGYTSATFSGRSAMPLVADSIVECGRRTLSNAIELANSWGREENGRWFGAEVIYGDTDSLFIRLRGRSVREAFEFGEAFCKAVTASNPPPVHLKLEKVYKGSMMQTKKKYCGMKFESLHERKPTFEAKGIETIRRDQCALTQKVLRNALITLFRSGIEAVKSYLFRQWCLILSGRLPVSDFILTGRVRSRYRGGRVGPVQAVLVRRLAEVDPGRVVRHKERVAYVIVATPGLTFRLRDCVLTPTELLEQWDAYTIHCEYYITKHVNAALQRCLGLAPHKIDIAAWYESCPKPKRRIHFWPVTRSGSNIMISSYFGSDICSLCGKKCRAQGRSRAVVCSTCREDHVKVTQEALGRLSRTQLEAQEIARACSKCNFCFEDATTFAALKSGQANSLNGSLSANSKANPGIVTPIANCTCIDCPNTFERHRLREAELEAIAICQALDIL